MVLYFAFFSHYLVAFSIFDVVKLSGFAVSTAWGRLEIWSAKALQAYSWCITPHFSQAGAIYNFISSSLVYFVGINHLHILVTCMNEI